jgi:hypothetical protein
MRTAASRGRRGRRRRSERFFDRLLTRFFDERDAGLLAGLGVNCLRVPVNYRHFERDERPFELLEAGFARQDRVVNLWPPLAQRYREEHWVAGYNLLNEPADPSGRVVGPVYTGDPERDEQRYEVLADQLEIYDRHAAGWAIWTYKDVCLQGLVSAAPESVYMRHFGALIDKKARLGVDSWGSTDEELPEVLEPVHELIAREFPRWSPYPWSPRATTDDLVRHVLFAQAMLPEYAERLRHVGDDELDELADSFGLEHCVKRERLCELLGSHMGTVAGQA